MTSLFRTGVIGGLFVLCTTSALWISLSACESLSQTSPLPSTDASDLDAGQPPEESTSSSSSGTVAVVDAGPQNAARVRLANFIQGPDAVDLCAKVDATGTSWQNGLIVTELDNVAGYTVQHPKGDGLLYGQTSQSIFVFAAAGAGTKYLFKIVPLNSDCADPNVTTYAQISPSTTVRPGAGITIVGLGKSVVEGVDAGDGAVKATVIADTLAPPVNASLFRVFHGVTDIAAFDVVVNGETLLIGVKYGTPLGFPYTSPNGFASVNAGIPEDATLTLRSGTTVRSFTVPQRLRRGVATTVFAGGTKDALTVSLCSDRTPAEGDTASCTKLQSQD